MKNIVSKENLYRIYDVVPETYQDAIALALNCVSSVFAASATPFVAPSTSYRPASRRAEGAPTVDFSAPKIAKFRRAIVEKLWEPSLRSDLVDRCVILGVKGCGAKTVFAYVRKAVEERSLYEKTSGAKGRDAAWKTLFPLIKAEFDSHGWKWEPTGAALEPRPESELSDLSDDERATVILANADERARTTKPLKARRSIIDASALAVALVFALGFVDDASAQWFGGWRAPARSYYPQTCANGRCCSNGRCYSSIPAPAPQPKPTEQKEFAPVEAAPEPKPLENAVDETDVYEEETARVEETTETPAPTETKAAPSPCGAVKPVEEEYAALPTCAPCRNGVCPISAEPSKKAPSAGERLAALINAKRFALGLRPVAYDAELSKGSAYEASCCARAMTLYHQPGWMNILAMNYSGFAQAVDQWASSPSHAAYIFGANYTRVGVCEFRDAYGRFWCAARFR